MGMVADDASIYALTANGPFDIDTGGPIMATARLRLGSEPELSPTFSPPAISRSSAISMSISVRVDR